MVQKHRLFLLGCIICSTVAHSQTMVPDSSFGTNGIATHPLQFEYPEPHSILIDDHKITLAIDYFNDYDLSISRIHRLTSTGEMDASFGTNGIIRTGGRSQSRVTGLLKQPDGKLLALSVQSYKYDWDLDTLWLQRFMPNGMPDSSFGENSRVYNHIEYMSMSAHALRLKPDGHIALLYRINDREFTGTDEQYVAQLSADGAVDKSFGKGGRVENASIYDSLKADMLALPDNSLLVACNYKRADAKWSSCLVRYLKNGKMDSSFGVNGVLLLNTVNTSVHTIRLRSQKNGKLLIRTTDDGNDVVLRYNGDATLDNSFGTNGKVVISASGSHRVYPQIEVQANERIVLTMRTGSFLKRLMPDGSLDASFGNNGLLDYSAIDYGQYGVAIKSYKNALIMSGVRYEAPYYRLKVAVYKPEGSAPVLGNGKAIERSITSVPGKMNAVSATSIKAYPNPVRTVFTVAGMQRNTAKTLILTNAAGQNVRTVNVQSATCQFNVAGLPPGLYYVTVLQDNVSPVTLRVVKE